MNFFIVLAAFFCTFFPSEAYKEKISWNEKRALTWQDFKGKPQSDADFVASTNSGMSFSFSYSEKNGKRSMEYSVVCNFYPQESWYKPGHVSEYILKHEQTHFDISELHARKLRKRMDETSFSKNVKKEVEALYQQTEHERRQMQNDYDFESDHSKNKEGEYRWRAKVAQELKKYERWKST